MKNKRSRTFKLKGIYSGKNGCPSPLPDNMVCLKYLESSNDIADVALFYSRAYEKIFFVKKKNETGIRRLFSVVRITRGDKTIRRMYRYDSSVEGISTGDMAMTMGAIALLTKEDEKAEDLLGEEITVTKGNWWDIHKYYWEHPFHATRISYKLGMPSLLIAIISLFLAIVSMFL